MGPMGAPVSSSLLEADWPLAIAVGVACGLAGLALIYAAVSTARQIEDDVPGLMQVLVRAILRRARPDGPVWVCLACRSVNPGAAGSCYRCHRGRVIPAVADSAAAMDVEAQDAGIAVFDASLLDPLVPVMATTSDDQEVAPRRPRRAGRPRHGRHLFRSRHRHSSRLTPRSPGA